MIARILLLGIGLLGFMLGAGAEGTEQLMAGPTPPQAAPDQLPVHLRWARDHPDRRPPPEVRREVRAEDKAWLMQQYRRQPKPNQRIALAWLLAYAGDDEVVRVFSEALRLGPSGRATDPSEVASFGELLLGMGVIAQTNDLAFQFLTEAVHPDWWLRERKWTAKYVPPVRLSDWAEIAGLAGAALHALGLSGRLEAGVVLDRMKKDGCKFVSPKDPAVCFNPAPNVCEAKRYLDISRRIGRQAFRDGLFGPEFKLYSIEWRRSEEGLKWFEWAYPRDGFPWIWKDVDAHFKLMESLFD